MDFKDLAFWRDHLVDSFSDEKSNYTRRFRFLKKDGLPPRLLMLQMGDTKSSKNGKSKEDGKPKDAGKGAKNAKSSESGKKSTGVNEKEGKSAGKKRKTKSRETVDSDEDESSAAYQASSDGSDFEGSRPERAKKRRLAAVKAAAILTPQANEGKKATNDLADPTNQISEGNPRPKPKPSRSSPRKSLPGSVEGRQITKASILERQFQRSMYFQTRSMEGGSLPVAWKRPMFDPKEVSQCL
jgi:hypothetical protein